MPSVCFYFQVHQPRRVKKYRIFDIGREPNYFNDNSESNLNNERIIRKVAGKSYLPANAVLLELLKCHPEFRVSFSFSGVLLEQLADWAPEVLDSFRKLVATGRVAVLAETYYHSLAFFYSLAEFEHQVVAHGELIRRIFGVRPKVFRNTELAYNDNLGRWAERAGFIGILAEGWDRVLDWKSPNFLYRPVGTKRIKLLLKNYRLSDDIAFRFSERSWSEWPLDASKFAQWVNAANGQGQVINLFMDYETFGEHQWADTGIFHFLRQLPPEILKHPDNDFVTVEEASARYPAMDALTVPEVLTWADTERDLSAWTGNELQTSSLAALYDLEPAVLASRDDDLIDAWRRLQTSDHFYYMCTKWFADGDVHAYFNPYASPYEAYISYTNALNDLRLRVEELKFNYAES
ncbi:MAG: polysaccharide deacetylase family protein [Candidatus Vogelbacteria bacterium]|nr:polysaccharide deacetylase family protein [Candidatus Vogelbacteria bacterium]